MLRRHALRIDFDTFSLYISFMPLPNGEIFGIDLTPFDEDLIASLFHFPGTVVFTQGYSLSISIKRRWKRYSGEASRVDTLLTQGLFRRN